jgi:hypothetical protein
MNQQHLHPDDLIVVVENEIASSAFSRDMSIDNMFPGIRQEMKRILGTSEKPMNLHDAEEHNYI